MDLLNLPWTAWILLLAAGINSCIGNLMLKQSQIATENLGMQALFFSPWLLGSLLFHGANVILFTKALDKIPVSIAYPILAGSGFLLLTISAHWLFHERLSLTQIFGLFSVIVGIILMSQK